METQLKINLSLNSFNHQTKILKQYASYLLTILTYLEKNESEIQELMDEELYRKIVDITVSVQNLTNEFSRSLTEIFLETDIKNVS